MKRVAWLACLLAVAATAAVHAQQVIGPNVNVISGINDFITGDPFLRQQNEPSMAVSVRNPEHMLAAANDYRTIEINQEFGIGEPSATLGMTPPSSKKEAWIGVYRSYDRGKSWLGGLAPGSPNDQSRASLASPSKGLNAGSDPAVVADTAGHFYVGYLAFTRGGNSKIVVARYTDRNNSHIVDTILYDFTKEVDRGSGNAGGAGSMNGVFLDKLWMAVDHSRTPGASADACGNVYIAYTKFDGVQKDGRARSSLLFSRSTDCGQTWSTPSKLNQPSNGSPNIRNQGVYLVVDPGNGDVFAYWPDYYEPHLLVVRSRDGGQSWTRPVRITANYPLSPYAQPSIALNSVNSSGQTLGVTFRSKSLPAVAIDGDGRHYVAIQEAVGPGVTYGATTYRAPRITLRITKDPMGTWPAPKIAVMGNGPQVMPAMLAINGLVSLMYYEAVPRTPGTCPAPDPVTMRCSKTLPNGSPVPDGQSRMDDAAGLDPVTHYISGMDREMNVWIAQAEPSDSPDFTGRLAKTSLFAFDPKVKAPADNRIERFYPNLPTNVSGTTPFIGDYNALAALNFVRADAPAVPGATATTSSQTPWRWAMGRSDGPGTVQGIWADTRAVVAPLLGDWQNFQTFPSCINPGSRNVNVYTTEISPGIVAGSPQPFGRLRPRDAVKDTSTTFVLYAENRTPDMRRFKFTVQAPNSVASFAQFFKDADGPALTVEDWVLPYGTSTRTLYAWLGGGSPTAPMRVTVDDVSLAPRSDNPRGWVAPGSELKSTNVLLNPDPNNPAIVDKENHGISVSAPQQPGPQQPGTSFGAPQQPGPQQPGPQQPGPQQPGSQVGAPQQPGTLVGDSSAQVVTWTTTGVGDVASAVNSITAITNYKALKDTHDFQLIAYRYLTNPVQASATVPGTQYCSINGRVAYVVANVINPNLAPQQPGPQQPGTGIINFYVSPQQPGPQQPGTAVDDGTTSAPRQSDQVQVTLIVTKNPNKKTSTSSMVDDAGGPSAFAEPTDPTPSPEFNATLAVHGDIPAAVDSDNTQQQGPTVTTSFQAPELTIGGPPIVAPQPVTAGTPLSVVGLKLSNTGNQKPNASDGNFQTRYYLSTDISLPLRITAGDVLLSNDLPNGGNITNDYLLPGVSVSLNASLLIPDSVVPGGYYVKVITDEDNEVAEGSELQAALGFPPLTNDNITTFPITVVTPDLVVCGTPTGGACASSTPQGPTPVVITGLQVSPLDTARVLAGGQITVSPFAVKNEGPGDAYRTSETDFLLSSNIPILLGTDATPILLAGQSWVREPFTLTIPAGTAVGNHDFIVRVDATNVFPHEADLTGIGSGENNNSVTTPLRVVMPLVSQNDDATTLEDHDVVVDVLANDLGPGITPTNNSPTVYRNLNGDLIRIIAIPTPPQHGTATIVDLNGNPTTVAGVKIDYVPHQNYNGTDTFTYVITDDQGQTTTQPALVTVHITPVNDPPEFTVTPNPNQTVLEDAPVQPASWATNIRPGPVLLSGDVQAAQDNELAQQVDFIVTNNNATLFSVQPAIDSNGTLTYSPGPNQNGQAAVTVKLHDNGPPLNAINADPGGNPPTLDVNTSQEVKFTITVLAVNDPPTAGPQQPVTTPEDTGVAIALTGSDEETAAKDLTFNVTQPLHGKLSAPIATNLGSTVTYSPDPNYNGPDSFTFTVTDRGDPDNCNPLAPPVQGCSAPVTSAAATVSITVVPVNDAPVAANDYFRTPEDTPLVVGNSMIENGPMCVATPSGLVAWWRAENDASERVGGHDGTLAGGVAFSAGEVSRAFAFNGVDGLVSVPASNDFNLRTALTIDAWLKPDHLPTTDVGVIAGRSHGYQLLLLTDGHVRFLFPVAGVGQFVDSAAPIPTDKFTHVAATYDQATRLAKMYVDGMLSNTATLQGPIDDMTAPFEIGGFSDLAGVFFAGIIDEVDLFNRALSASQVASIANAGAAGKCNGLLTNDTDVETPPLLLTASIVTPPSHAASFSLSADGSFTYLPAPDYNGADSFTYQVTDAGDPTGCNPAGDTPCAKPMPSAAATVAITVVPVNDAPTATAPPPVSLNEHTTAAITLSGSDLETGDPANLTYTIVAGPTNGTLSGTGRNRTYTPNANYSGPDSFTFTVTDRGDPDNCGTASTTCAAPMTSAAAIVSITVVPVNNAPVAADDAGVASAGASTFIDVLVNDSDVDGDTLTIQSFTQGSQGSVGPFGTGLNYTPGPGFVDTDSFTYTISDGHGGTATATVRIYRRVSIGDIVISEFRFRGAGDGVDQFIELYNNTDEPITVRSLDGSSGWSVVEDGGRQLMFLPNGTVLAPRGHLLGTQWYSHDQPPGVGSIVHPYAGVAQNRLGSEFNFTWGYYDGHQIPENSGIALFGTTASANWTLNTRVDAVGFQTSNSLYRSGGGLTPIVVSDTEKSFVRRSIGFTAQNTFNNSTDFVLVSTDTTPIATLNGGSIQPAVGAPGPEHFSAPRYATDVGTPTLVATLIDTGVSGTAAPNQVRSENVLTLRRTLTNFGSAAISRIRLRIVDIATLGTRSGYEADLRAMSAANQVVTLSDSSNVDVIGAQVETIPAQPNGGGLNSGLEIPLTAPLAPGQSVRVQFSFNVVTDGTLRINTDVPIMPVILPAPFLQSATANQPYTGGTLSAVGAASPTWTLVTGGALLAQYGLTFNSNGTITGTPNAAGSIPLTVRLEDGLTGLRTERSYFLNVGGPLDVSPFQFRAVVGEFFSGVRLVGGRGIRQFKLLSPPADLPSGLAFDPNVGLIGTPKATGTFELSFGITDCNLQSGTPSCPSGVAQQDITRTVPITMIAVEQQGFGDTTSPVAFGGSGGRSLAQVFTSGVGGVLDSIRLNQLSCPTGTQVTVNILLTENSAPFKPFGSPVATGTGYIGLVFNGPVIPLSAPVPLSPGLRLAFEVQTDAVCAMLRLPTQENYSGGEAFAGTSGGFELLSTTDGRFDLVFRTMTQQDGLLYTTVPLGWHTATPLVAADGTLNGGKILLAGPSGAAAIYDPVTHALLATGAMRKSRQNHTATLLRCPVANPLCTYDGKVLITGGKSFPGDGTTIYESSAELFDPKANGGVGAFSDVVAQLGGSTPRARIYHTATRLDDGTVLIVGGRSTDGGTTGIQDAEFFDPGTMAFTPGPLDTTRRWQHTATRVAGGKVLVAGGYTAAGTFTSAQVYDPTTGQFASPSGGGLHFNRGQHTATLLPAFGKVLIVGGQWASALVMTAELFDPAMNTFTDAGNIAEGRLDAAAVALADGATVLIAGGNSSNFCCPVPPPLASIERYIGGTPWQSAGSMVVVRPNLSMTLLTGGLNSGKVLAASGGGASFVTAQSVELIDSATTLGLAKAPPSGDLGQPYPDFTLSVTGVVTAEFHQVAGSLPPGLTFDDGKGHIHGIVDTAAPIGTYQFGVQIVDTADASRRSIQTLSIRVLAPFVISTSAVPTALTGRNYAQSLTASGGSGARTWTIVAGGLPPGLMLGRDGVLFGSPTTTAPGSFSVTLQATDDTGHLTTKVITVNVGLPADESEWTTTFPYGATIVGAGLAVDQGDANSVYVVAQNRGLYRTTDTGGSWISLTDHLSNFSTQVGTTSMFFDKSNFNVVRMIGSGLASTLYVVTQNNVFKTTDQGATWTFSGSGIGGSVQTLVVALSNPAVLYAGTFSNGVYQTTDGGANWTAMSSLPLAANSTTPSSIRAIAVDPGNPGLVYVGTNDQGVYKFENGWSQIGGALLKRVDSLVIKPDLSVLFAVGQDSSDGVFRLDLLTSNATWQKATTQTGGSNPFFSAGCCSPGDKITIDPLNTSRLYVATANSGIWISTDGGASLTFQPITGLQSSTVAVATGIVDATAVIYVGTFGQGVYKSLDGGLDWLEASTGLRAINFPHGNVHSLAFDATSPSKVYAGSVARGFRSVDGGASWQPKTTWSLPGFSANAIATHQAEPGVVYVFGSSSGFGNTCCFNLWKSDSSGTNFQPISINTGTGNLCCWGDGDIALHPSQPLTMWVAASNFNPGGLANGVYMTIDGGATWTLLSNTGLTNTNAHSLTIDPADPDSPYLVVRGSFSAGWTPGGVFKWNGVSSRWDKLPIIPSTQTDQTFNPDQILVNPGNGDLLVTAQGSSSNSGLYRSTDGAATWSRVLNDNVSAVAVNPLNTNQVYVGTWNSGGFRRNSDGGTTWVPANEGLPLQPTIESIVLDPTNPYRVLLATEGGVWVRTFPSGAAGDVSLTKSASPTVVTTADSVTFTVRATNVGPSSVTGVIVTDPLPADATFVSAGSSVGSCSIAGGVVSCDVGTLTSTQIATITIVVTPMATGAMSNTASVSATESDPNTANNSATANVTVNPPPLQAPTPLAPISNAAIVQNNSTIACSLDPTRGYGFQIQFDWTDSVPAGDVAGYDLYAKWANATLPIVNTFVTGSSAYTYTSCNAFVPDSNLMNWQWKVRARSNSGAVTDWSPAATFQFAQCRLSDGTPCHS